MHVLVTGGAGFIGGWLCNELLQRGHTVLAVDDLSGATKDRVNLLDELYGDAHNPRFRFHFGSCFNLKWMRELFTHYKIDTLVHCAANARESASQFQPGIITERNLGAYSNTLSAAIAAGVKNVVCFSSLAVYGEGHKNPPPFVESQRLEPEDVYGVNKMAMEMTTRILCELHGVNYVIVRPHNVFGEWQEMRDPFRNVVGIFLNKCLRGEKLVLFNNGNNVRAFSYIHDALPALVEVTVNTAQHNKLVVNIGGMTPIKVIELADAVLEEIHGVNYNTDDCIQLAPPRPCEVEVAYTDHNVQEKELGYTETIGWREGVTRMAKWAQRCGPQEWCAMDELEITDSPLIPQAWRDMLAGTGTRK